MKTRFCCESESDGGWRGSGAVRFIIVFCVLKRLQSIVTVKINNYQILIDFFGWMNFKRWRRFLPLRRGARGEIEAEWWRRSWWWAIWPGRFPDCSFCCCCLSELELRETRNGQLDCLFALWRLRYIVTLCCCLECWTGGVRDGRRLELICDETGADATTKRLLWPVWHATHKVFLSEGKSI